MKPQLQIHEKKDCSTWNNEQKINLKILVAILGRMKIYIYISGVKQNSKNQKQKK